MKIHHARTLLWIVLLGSSTACARRDPAQMGPPQPTEAGQETPPGVPAVVQPRETGEPSPPNQDVPPGVQPTRDDAGEAGQETPPAVGDTPATQTAPVAAAAQTEQEFEESVAERARDEEPEVRELMLLGPTYTPHDRAPTVVWDTDVQALLSRKLLPVIQSEGLSARTRSLFWVLLRSDGSIADVVPQTLSENARFDAAAAEIVRQLRFTPAIRSERAVPVWVIQEISLLMQ